MTKVKTSELTGSALDWAVAKCEGHDVVVLTVQEQRERWLDAVPPENLAKETAEYDEYFAANAKPLIRIKGDDGFKRTPYHTEALMLYGHGIPMFQYHESWSQAGPIMEREFVGLRDFMNLPSAMRWRAHMGADAEHKFQEHGPTPLIAAMRCYVASKLGDEVDVPEELLQ